MSTNNQTKINRLLQSQPPGVVYLSSWLEANGYSRDLQRRYIKSGWLKPFGRGALIRPGQEVKWVGAVYAIQNQTRKNIHVGGRSALNLLGLSHYLELKQKKIDIFTYRGVNLPSWFIESKVGFNFNLIRTDFLPSNTGLVEYEESGITILISSPIRALMECLYMAPSNFDLIEAYQIMEGLTAVHPDDVQIILSGCKSIKVVRLFLYLAEKSDHQWIKHLDMKKINTGKGKRSIVRKGVLIPKYDIIVPIELANA